MRCDKNKILHVVYAMNAGGIESWLMSVYRNIDRDNISFDFLVNSKDESFFDKEVKELGGSVIFGGRLKNPIDIYNRSKNIFNSGSYSAVHCHNVENAFPVLKAAYDTGIPSRIYHCHNNIDRKLSQLSFFKQSYLKISNRLAIYYATKLLSVSKESGDILFNKSEYQQVSLGIELLKYSPDKKYVLNKANFGLSDDDLIIGHVGRFDPLKNHIFIIKIAVEIIKIVPNAKFVLVGIGKQEVEIKHEVAKRNLENNFLFLGLRDDVPQLMLNIMDMLLFPSLSEGLGLVVVEAQAAGLPIVCSNNIPNEAIVNKQLVKVLELQSSAQKWALDIMNFYSNFKEMVINEPLSVVRDSDFNLNRTITILESLWLEKN